MSGLMRIIGGSVFIFVGIAICASPADAQSSDWKAPPSAKELRNPVKNNSSATAGGKVLYSQICEVCHGRKGKGDGLAGMALNPRPANLTKEIVQRQSDGEIFWKLTEGRAPMASYKDVLTEKQRWELVNFIRELGS